MNCAQCGDSISGNPIKQGEDFFCSLECANAAAGYASEDEESYYEEDDISESYRDEFEE